MPKISAGSNTYKSLQYCINQEKFLRVFLSNDAVPMDNNVAERAIRPFTLGRKNWVNMDSIRGAQASATLYSLVETAKANNLRYMNTWNTCSMDSPDTLRIKTGSLLRIFSPGQRQRRKNAAA